MTITRIIVVLAMLVLLIGMVLIWLYAWALKLREVSRWMRQNLCSVARARLTA